MRRVFSVFLFGAVLTLGSQSLSKVPQAPAAPSPAPAPLDHDGIQIATGSFGTLGDKRKLDIVARLQELCGTGAQSCHVFCSETSFGRYSLGRDPICRVTYRCGAEFVRSVEALREEPILMRCPERREDQPLIPPTPTN